MWKAKFVAQLALPSVAELVSHQKIDYSLQLAKDYNEDLIRVFYSGLHAKDGSSFKFTIGNVIYEFTYELWNSLFVISNIDLDVVDEPDSLVTNVYTHVDYNVNVEMNKMLRAHHPEGSFEPLTTGQLKIIPRILLWLVSHVIHPKNCDFQEFIILKFTSSTFYSTMLS